MDSTGSIHAASKTLVLNKEHSAIYATLSAAEDLKAGASVKMTADNTVGVVTAATDLPIGKVVVGGDSGKKVTVLANASAILLGAAKGGALAAGALVRQDGTFNADDVPNYVAAASTHFADGVVKVGGEDTEEVEIFSLKQPFVVA